MSISRKYSESSRVSERDSPGSNCTPAQLVTDKLICLIKILEKIALLLKKCKF